MYAKDLTGLPVFTNIDIKRQPQTKGGSHEGAKAGSNQGWRTHAD
jgi:hypothetical protein